MRLFKSIRFKLTAWYTCLLLAGLGAFGGGTLMAGHSALVASMDARLDDRVSGLISPLEDRSALIEAYAYRMAARPELVAQVFPEHADFRELKTAAERRAFSRMVARDLLESDLSSFVSGLPSGEFMAIRDAHGNLLTDPSPVGLSSADPAAAEVHRATVRAGVNEYRMLRQTLDIAGERYSFVTGSSTAGIHQVRRDVLQSLRWLTLVFLGLAVGGGAWMSGRALRPIDALTAAARSTGIGDLSRRLEIQQTDGELQRLTETWNTMLQRLESAVHRIRQFTSDASHELRTPTAAVRATAELALRQERSPNEYRSALATVLAEATRMSELIDDLLMLARADEGGKATPVEALRLDDLVARVCEDYAILAQEKAIALQVSLGAPKDRCEGNRTALRRLCVVLLDNAIAYTPSGGTVSVSTERLDSRVVLRVRDDGPGVPQEALPHLFDRFFRCDDDGRARPTGGAGLGLALAKSIARDHDATISASNAEAGGAVFSVEFAAPAGTSSET